MTDAFGVLPEANRNVSSYFSAHGVSVVSQAGFSSAEKGRAYTARDQRGGEQAACSTLSIEQCCNLAF